MDGSELKFVRKAAGLTQLELANNLGLSRVFLGLMERGERPISRRTVQAVRAIEVRPLDVISTETDPLFRQFENALITSGINFEVTHHSERDVSEYLLIDLNIRIKLSRDERTNTIEDRDITRCNITVRGKSAIKLLADLLCIGGGRASTVPLPDRKTPIFAEMAVKPTEADR